MKSEYLTIDGESVTLEELEDAIESCETCLGDSLAEYHSEVALFGDAGPGSWLRILDMKAGLAELKAKLPPRPAPEPENIVVFEDDGSVPF